jgi:hypothetical protein
MNVWHWISFYINYSSSFIKSICLFRKHRIKCYQVPWNRFPKYSVSGRYINKNKRQILTLLMANIHTNAKTVLKPDWHWHAAGNHIFSFHYYRFAIQRVNKYKDIFWAVIGLYSIYSTVIWISNCTEPECLPPSQGNGPMDYPEPAQFILRPRHIFPFYLGCRGLCKKSCVQLHLTQCGLHVFLVSAFVTCCSHNIKVGGPKYETICNVFF